VKTLSPGGRGEGEEAFRHPHSPKVSAHGRQPGNEKKKASFALRQQDLDIEACRDFLT
jgi:hypothetical protein